MWREEELGDSQWRRVRGVCGYLCLKGVIVG